MSFQIGDRVRLDNAGDKDNFTGVGKIVSVKQTSSGMRATIKFEECSHENAPNLSYHFSRLTLEPRDDMSQADDRYSNDPAIRALITQMDGAVAVYQSGRDTGDYARMNLGLGMMSAIVPQFYQRNAEIDLEHSRTGKEIAKLSIPEAVLEAFPGADVNELACEGEHLPRIADVLSPNPAPGTHSAMPARIETLSGQVFEVTRLDCQDPSLDLSLEPDASCPATEDGESAQDPGEHTQR